MLKLAANNNNSTGHGQAPNAPYILKNLAYAFKGFLYNPESFPTLANCDHRIRTMRLERRQACVEVLGVLVKYLDLATLRVKFPDGKNLHWRRVVQETGLGWRRVKRAVRDLKLAGILVVVQKRTKKRGLNRSTPAIKFFSWSLYKALGLDDQARRALKWAKTKPKAQRKRTKREEGQAELTVQAAAATLGTPKKPNKAKAKPRQMELEIERERQLYAYKLFQDNPGLSAQEINDLAALEYP